MRYSQILLVAAAVPTLSPQFAPAQSTTDYPNRPVRVIVASSPGGGTDVLARMFAQRLNDNLKRQLFVVDNRPGAGDTIGLGLAAKGAPDGYTLLGTSPSLTIVKALNPDFPFDPVKDFTPISLVAGSPLLLVAHPSLPAKSIKELIALAKSRPGALDLGVGPNGSFLHLGAAHFVSSANIKVTIIPYKLVANGYADAIGGQIHMLFGNVLNTLIHVKSGRLRALGVTSAKRSSALPELPTISEAGVPGYDVTTWHGWLGPAGMPAAIVSKLSVELATAARSPDVVKKLAEDGGDPIGRTPEQFQQLIAAELPRWRKAAKDSGMRVE